MSVAFFQGNLMLFRRVSGIGGTMNLCHLLRLNLMIWGGGGVETLVNKI